MKSMRLRPIEPRFREKPERGDDIYGADLNSHPETSTTAIITNWPGPNEAQDVVRQPAPKASPLGSSI